MIVLLRVPEIMRCSASPVRSRFLAVLFAVVCVLPASGETAVLECTADVGIGVKATGYEEQLGLQKGALLNFRFGVTRGWSVSKATLLVHIAQGETPQHVEIGFVSQNWTEQKPPEIGRSVRFHRVKPAPQADRWMTIPLDPPLVELMIEGKMTGLVVRTSRGQPLAIHSRQAHSFVPYLIVEGHKNSGG